MGSLSPVHWAIVIVVLLLLFGSRKLPDMARGLGQSMRILKAEGRALQDDDRRDGPAPTAGTDTAERANPAAHPATGADGPATAQRDAS
ncbi:Sec-independent protein translocase subunit TatA [Actinomycetospora atypica]|uniref:Sec-independent protein translocase protein TatA n=1 Tax=Actinomycetospora atypica TaxID=1290095 RepID=A0ABV9YCU7_9PSEU